jgi:hypothetical protein
MRFPDSTWINRSIGKATINYTVAFLSFFIHSRKAINSTVSTTHDITLRYGGLLKCIRMKLSACSCTAATCGHLPLRRTNKDVSDSSDAVLEPWTCWLWRHAVLYVVTNVSEELITSMFRVENGDTFFPKRWQLLTKLTCRHNPEEPSVTFNGVKTSNLTSFSFQPNWHSSPNRMIYGARSQKHNWIILWHIQSFSSGGTPMG